jgi:hypothetical protein
MHRVILGVLLLAGCGWEGRVKLLSDAEFDHYYALKPFMEDSERKAYLKLKTEEERNGWLKANGCRELLGKQECYWDRFYKYPENIRQGIVEGAVRNGWTREMVYMAWGSPWDRLSLVGRPAAKSEMFVYRFEKHEDGTVLVYVPDSKTAYKAVSRFTREVYMDNDQVTEIVEKPGWGAE